MRIAIVKPDYRIVGGFEIVVERIIKGLRSFGHRVDLIKVDMLDKRYNLGNIQIPEEIYNQNEEYFRYVMSIQEYEKLDLDSYDYVICTQPPSFAVNHPNVAVLFYHHLKIYYDLDEVYLKCMAKDRELHEYTKSLIRAIDQEYINNDKFYLAGSQHVANRLKYYNEIKDENISVFKAGIGDEYFNYNGKIEYKYPICVGRHEFPKRPELFIDALKHIPELQGKLVGMGGKTEDLKILDRYLQYAHEKGIKINAEELWKEIVFNVHKLKFEDPGKSNVLFTGKVSNHQVLKEYAEALCVVCPSYEEDYGLTAIEAMSFRKPIIACSDGGGYKEFIIEGKNGFVVEPSGEAIAEKIKYLNENKDKAKEMGKYAYEFSRKYSWDIAIEELNKQITNRMK